MLPDILIDGYETADSPDEFLTELGEDGASEVETALGFPEGSLRPEGAVAKVVFGNVSSGFRPFIAYREDRGRLSDRPYIGFWVVDRECQDFAVLRNPNSGHLVLAAYFDGHPVISISGTNGSGDLPTLVSTATMLWRYGNFVADHDARKFGNGVARRLERIVSELRG